MNKATIQNPPKDGGKNSLRSLIEFLQQTRWMNPFLNQQELSIMIDLGRKDE